MFCDNEETTKFMTGYQYCRTDWLNSGNCSMVK
jgi:hypothetical protein